MRARLQQLERVGLAPRAHHHPAQLSGGQQQRVAIARALVNEPKLILADEPTGALDSTTSVEVMALLQALNRGGITIVLVTHEHEIAAFASRLIAFRDGHVVSDTRNTPLDADAALAKLAAPRMTFLATLKVALAALRTNKLRSALTMLGIIIGVGAVIAMVGVGAGAQARVEDQIKSLGSNLIIVLSGNVMAGGARMGAGSQPTISEDDAYALQREVPTIEAAAPQLRGSGQVVFGNSNWATSIIGISPEYFVARNWVTTAGRAIEPADIDAGAKVVVLGQTVARNLFGEADPVGETIRIRRVPHAIVGLLERKGQSMVGQDQDDVVLIPISTARKRVLGGQQVKSRSVQAITIKVQDGADLSVAEQEIRDLLRQRHRLQANQEDDFFLRNLAGSARRAGGELARAGDAARGDRVGFADRRRHRHHEHHAGIGHRAHARDRVAHGGGRARPRYPAAIPGRSGDARGDRRPRRDRAWRRRILRRRPFRRLAHRDECGRHHSGGQLRRRDRRVLRVLSGAEGGAAGADRCAAARVTQKHSDEGACVTSTACWLK